MQADGSCPHGEFILNFNIMSSFFPYLHKF